MSDDYKKFLEEKASRNKTPEEIIDSIVKEATGATPDRKTRLMLGEANEVYDVQLPEKENVVVRIHRSNKPAFDHEKWAIDKCSVLGIPVPQVLAIKHLQEDDKVLSICVQTKLPGDLLERGNTKIWELPEEQAKELMHKSGDLLSRMHSISVEGFGDIDALGKGIYSSFEELMMEKPDQREQFVSLTKRIDLPLEDIEKALDIIEVGAHSVLLPKAFLNHGDFGPKHLLYEGNEITGVIDFGEVIGHSPVYDIARWEYWFEDTKFFKWLKEGYTNQSIFGKEYEARSKLIRLDMSLGTISWYAKDNYKNGIDHGVNKLKALLADL